MLELLINPKRAEKRPWEMFLVGFFYAGLSVLLVTWIFSRDPVLAKYAPVLIITFTVMFTWPFMYYTIRLEEEKEIHAEGLALLAEHKKALYSLLWLFIGFVVAYSALYVILGPEQNFSAQIETYCMINRPFNFEGCVSQYRYQLGLSETTATGYVTGNRFASILANNIYVLVFTLVFSLIFGAGAIFILAWNASVIAAAIGIFTNSQLRAMPLGLLRYMVHGLPEIAAYFIAALAGGIVSIGVIKHDIKSQHFLNILQDALFLVILALCLLVIAAFIEVYVTPALFSWRL